MAQAQPSITTTRSPTTTGPYLMDHSPTLATTSAQQPLTQYTLMVTRYCADRKYVMELLECAHMASCNPFRTSIDTESKLSLDGDPVLDPTLYRSLPGGLQYLIFTRLDICYVVQMIYLYMHDPREPHWAALKRILYAIYLSANHVQHQWMKHIEIDIHFVRDMVTKGQVRILHVSSRYQYTDNFTKGLSSTLFEEFCTSLSVCSSPAQTAPAQTAGEC
ncbi:ribonuclease H-like domain-containing protein [Tanacetum coccineum]